MVIHFRFVYPIQIYTQANTSPSPSHHAPLVIGIHPLLQTNAQLLSYGLQLLQILLILLWVLHLELDTLFTLAIDSTKYGKNAPSKIRTAVGKSLTRRAARRAAVHTLGEGTRS